MSILLTFIFIIIISFLVYNFSESLAVQAVLGGAVILGGVQCGMPADEKKSLDMSAYDNIYIDGNNFFHEWKQNYGILSFTAEDKADALFDLGKIMGNRFPNSHIHIITKNQNLYNHDGTSAGYNRAKTEILNKTNLYENYLKKNSKTLEVIGVGNVYFHLCFDYNPVNSNEAKYKSHGYFARDDATMLISAGGYSSYIYDEKGNITKKRSDGKQSDGKQQNSTIISMDYFKTNDLEEMIHVPPFTYIVYHNGELIFDKNVDFNRSGKLNYIRIYEKYLINDHFGFKLDDFSTSNIYKTGSVYKPTLTKLPYCIYIALNENNTPPAATPDRTSSNDSDTSTVSDVSMSSLNTSSDIINMLKRKRIDAPEDPNKKNKIDTPVDYGF
jgi:hypothetical protein